MSIPRIERGLGAAPPLYLPIRSCHCPFDSDRRSIAAVMRDVTIGLGSPVIEGQINGLGGDGGGVARIGSNLNPLAGWARADCTVVALVRRLCPARFFRERINMHN